MKQYAVDLRERRLRAMDAGLSQAEASRRFGVGTGTITRWRQQRSATGHVGPQPRAGRPPRIGPAEAAGRRRQVAPPPDARLAAHGAHGAAGPGVPMSVPTLSRAIRRLGITLKKSPPGQ